MRSVLSVAAIFASLVVISACSSSPSHTSERPRPEPIAPIARAALPTWIESVAPGVAAEDGDQIRIRFRHDLVPVEMIEAPDRAATLSFFTIEPALPGRFLFLTPKMVGFESDAPIPHALRVRITLRAGLMDRSGNRLDKPYVWTFATHPPHLIEVSADDANAANVANFGLTPELYVASDGPLDEGSLLAHTSLVDVDDPKNPVPLRVAIASPAPSPTADAVGPQMIDDRKQVSFVPMRSLVRNRRYRFSVAPGVTTPDGNIPTTDGRSGSFSTYGDFRTTDVENRASPYTPRFADGDPYVTFTTRIDPKTIAGSVAISPQVRRDLPLASVSSDGDLAIDPFVLAPDTTYTLTLGPKLRDEFGQQLVGSNRITFSTGDLHPDLWAPSGFAIFSSDRRVALDLQTTNVPPNAFRKIVRRVEPSALIDEDPAYRSGSFLPASIGWPKVPGPLGRNRLISTKMDVRATLGGPTGMFAYGFRADLDSGTQGQAPEFSGVIESTNIGVFAQWFPHGGTIRVASLRDGAPVAGAAVAIYPSFANRPFDAMKVSHADEAPCARATTGIDGTADIDATAFTPCAAASTSGDAAPELLTIVRQGRDWAYVRTPTYAYGDVNFGWSAGKPNAHGTIVSDRAIYQRGERACFSGIAYFETDGELARARSTSFAITMRTPSGKSIAISSVSPDAYGALSFSIPIGARAELGFYDLMAVGVGGEVITGQFRVAEFRPPNFNVDLRVDRDAVRVGTPITATATSTYLFGAPLAAGTAHVAVTRSRADFGSANAPNFIFGRSWYYPEEPPEVGPDVLQSDLTLDGRGRATTTIPTTADIPYPMVYRVEVDTKDVANITAADVKTVTVLPGPVAIGLRADYFATAGTPFSVAAIAVDARGTVVVNRPLTLRLERREYGRAIQMIAGGETPRDSVHYVPIATRKIVSAKDATRILFTAPTTGEYRVRANLSGATSDATATDATLWVAGPEFAAWNPDSRGGSLTIKLNKARYRVGDVATALVQSPFPAAHLVFAVVRHGVIERQARDVRGGAPVVRFRVSPAMFPNAAVQVSLVRDGAAPVAATPQSVTALSSTGFAAFRVALDAKYVHVALSPAKKEVAPGGDQTIVVRLHDANGRPITGKCTVAVVNERVLQLTGYRFPDLVQTVYADQPISTVWADNRDNVRQAMETRIVQKGFGFGGGEMAGLGSTRVRTNFQALAYFNGNVLTDDRGVATVHIRVPDDLTMWRVLVLAFGKTANFGSADTTFIATRPVVAEAVVPQFVRPGDRFAAGVAVTNRVHANGAVRISGRLGGGLAFASGAHDVRTTEKAMTALTQAYRYAMRASGSDAATFAFGTRIGSYVDAFSLRVPIVTEDLTATTATAGATTNSAEIPLVVNPRLQGPLGGLEVTLASTLLADVREPAHALESDRSPFALSVGSRVGIAADVAILDARYGRLAERDRMLASLRAELVALHELAVADGGYAPWPGASESELYSTAFVATQLAQAARAGVDVHDEIARVRPYLAKMLASPELACRNSVDASCTTRARLEALETLGTIGLPRSDFLSEILDESSTLSFYERVELARHLHRLPDWQGAARALRARLLERVHLGAREAIVDLPGGSESPVDGQAQLLGMLIESHAPIEDIDNVLRSLLALRRNGTWGCLCDDAEALAALVSYAGLDRTPPRFLATLDLPTRPPQTTIQFTGYSRTAVTRSVSLAKLTSGASRIRVRKVGAGTLRYVVAFRYPISSSAPGVYQELRIDRIVRHVGKPDPVAMFGLRPSAGAVRFMAGDVFDIEDRIVTDHPVDNVIIIDPIPAGMEAVDRTFRNAIDPTAAADPNDDRWTADYQAIERSRVTSFVHHLEAGSYAFHYITRTVTPGMFAWPAATVTLEETPEQFGRTASGLLELSERPKATR